MAKPFLQRGWGWPNGVSFSDSNTLSPVPRSQSFPLPPKPAEFQGFYSNLKTSANSLALTTSSSTEDDHSDRSESSRNGSHVRTDSTTSVTSPALSLSHFTTNTTSHEEGQGPGLWRRISKALVECAGPIGPEDEEPDPAAAEEQEQERSEPPRFFPADEIEKVICPENIREESQFANISSEDLAGIIPRRRKLFVILTQIGQGQAIYRFIRDEIDDDCLPFYISRKDNNVLVYRNHSANGLLDVRSSSSSVPDDTARRSLNLRSDGWAPWDVNSFYNYQWQMLAPHFNLDCPYDSDQATTLEAEPHQKFPSEYRIPFIRIKERDLKNQHTPILSDPSISRHEVKKAYIHPAHRNKCRHTQTHNPPDCHTRAFAVKLIDRSRYRKTAEREIDTLRRFDKPGVQHRHRLIRLLYSFEYNDKFYLIFPHADANLWQLWEHEYPVVTDLPRGPELARWVAGEMLGLVRGLHLIHHAPRQNDTEEEQKNNGRHGDIKPENILWFRDHTDPDLNSHSHHHEKKKKKKKTAQEAPPPPPIISGMLKICDFDVADFHGDLSVSCVDPAGLAMTDAYSAPEGQLGRGYLSQAYDSWSLGCVLLQFVTWYALGFEGINTLYDELETPVDYPGLRGQLTEGRFFKVDAVTRLVDLKGGVIEQIAMLRNHKESSLLFDEVLDVIETRLLKPNPDDRARTGELVDRFHTIYKKSQRSEEYCASRGEMGYDNEEGEKKEPVQNHQGDIGRGGDASDGPDSTEVVNAIIPEVHDNGPDELLVVAKEDVGPVTGGKVSWDRRAWGFLRTLFCKSSSLTQEN